jgi:hypothetical protein
VIELLREATMRQKAVWMSVLVAVATSTATAALPGKQLLTFNVAVRPLSPSVDRLACISDRTIAIASATGPQVKVVDVNDPMSWTAEVSDGALRLTTRNGSAGNMRITARDVVTLRAIADEGVAESLVIDYRSGRAVFTTARNLAESELIGRVHYMRCIAGPTN